jgi:hypothetical protein
MDQAEFKEDETMIVVIKNGIHHTPKAPLSARAIRSDAGRPLEERIHSYYYC